VNHYRCFIRGENFLFRVDGVSKRVGFYTTRWLDAENPEQAEASVIALLRNEPDLQKPDWYDGSGPPAKVYVEEIVVCSADSFGQNAGFSFFEEGS
jgi:hypothetical protein